MKKKNTLEALGFDKVEVKQRRTRDNEPAITLNNYGSAYSLRLNNAITKLSGLRKGDRVDLYCLGETFALKPCSVGCLHLNDGKSGGLLINSINTYLEIRSRLKDKTKSSFTAWVEDDIVFFK